MTDCSCPTRVDQISRPPLLLSTSHTGSDCCSSHGSRTRDCHFQLGHLERAHQGTGLAGRGYARGSASTGLQGDARRRWVNRFTSLGGSEAMLIIAHTLAGNSADSKEGVLSFKEKRPPVFTASIPASLSSISEVYPWWIEKDVRSRL